MKKSTGQVTPVPVRLMTMVTSFGQGACTTPAQRKLHKWAGRLADMVLVNSAKATIQHEFSLQRMIRDTEALYRSLLPGKGLSGSNIACAV